MLEDSPHPARSQPHLRHVLPELLGERVGGLLRGGSVMLWESVTPPGSKTVHGRTA